MFLLRTIQIILFTSAWRRYWTDIQFLFLPRQKIGRRSWPRPSPKKFSHWVHPLTQVRWLIICDTHSSVTDGQIKKSLKFLGNKIPEPPARALLRTKLHQQLDGQRLSEVLEQLKRCPAGLDPALGKSIRFGVAYHHAGNEIKLHYSQESILILVFFFFCDRHIVLWLPF